MFIQEAADTVTPLRDETGIIGVVVKGSITFQNADSSLLRVSVLQVHAFSVDSVFKINTLLDLL
jgi:hypothetical protein